MGKRLPGYVGQRSDVQSILTISGEPEAMDEPQRVLGFKEYRSRTDSSLVSAPRS